MGVNVALILKRSLSQSLCVLGENEIANGERVEPACSSSSEKKTKQRTQVNFIYVPI